MTTPTVGIYGINHRHGKFKHPNTIDFGSLFVRKYGLYVNYTLGSDGKQTMVDIWSTSTPRDTNSMTGDIIGFAIFFVIAMYTLIAIYSRKKIRLEREDNILLKTFSNN